LIAEIGESLLQSYSQTPLLSKYDIYQILMDYWSDTMQDDVYVLVQDGWSTGKVLRELEVKKGEKLRETPDLVIGKTKYKAELIPPALIVARYFADEQTKIDTLQSKLDSASQELESYLEENSGDDGLLNEALNDKDKVTKATVTARLKVATDPDEKSALKQAQKLFDNEANAKKALKKAQDALDLAVFKQYPKLSIDEINTLIIKDKWLATLQSNIEAEIERVTQQLANRVKELEERYNEPLPAITKSVKNLSEKVAGHLKAMGLEWEL
ncbi:TPA: type I restriction endonuclease subunit M, partial [Escherichia coli]|nr:type I restriction endonuclease subunit M [Escherichia coli]HAY3840222.1 type I restriction endonuclease subunit M [Escherichia coli]HAY3888283.1 type I restriction endonuclease subunit M [Escherichia coli]HCI7869421.1 type I restriction endonuclease subunit M [Escherichia coli]